MLWKWRMIPNLKRNWLVVSKLTWEIWQILTRALKILTNFHFKGLLLSKVYIIWDKKVQKVYLSWQWRVMQNLERNWRFVSKLTRGIRQIFTRALGSLKTFYVNGLLFINIYIAWLKKVQRSYLLWHWIVMQNLERNWFIFSKLI